MTRVQRMSLSNVGEEIPAPGESIRLLADEDLAEALQEALVEHDKTDITDVEEDLIDIDDDMEINMHADANKFASAFGVSPTGKSKVSQISADTKSELPQADKELNLASVDSHEATDNESEQIDDAEEVVHNQKNIKTYLIGGAILAAIIIVIAVISSLVDKSDEKQPEQEPSVESQTNTAIPERYGNDQLAPTDSLTYQDSMTIDKYIEIDADSCVFVFTGYAENARAFVKAYVDIDTYNLYKIGARVPILYEHITIGDKDYYMKVRVNN